MPRHVAYILSQLEDNEKLVYPWHRVVAGNGTLGAPKKNPDGTSQSDLLREEGLVVSGNRIASGFERLLMQAEELPSGLPRQQRPANAPKPKSRPSARVPKR
jgi:methylated-DNA-protein-cysteine methyltransferase-like protein